MSCLSIALLRGIYLLITCSLWCFSASSKETHVEPLFSTWRLVRWKSPESSVALCVCAQLFSCVQLFATPWTVARKAPLSIYQARILNRVAISLFRGSSWPRGQTPISHIGRWILYHWATWGSLRGFRIQLLGLAGPLFLLFSGFVCMASEQGSASLKLCGAARQSAQSPKNWDLCRFSKGSFRSIFRTFPKKWKNLL